MAKRSALEQHMRLILDGSMTRNPASALVRTTLPASLTCFVLLLAVVRPLGPASTAAADAPSPGRKTNHEINPTTEAPTAKRDNDADAVEAPENRRRRENLRYAQRSFDEWRDQLLNDLDPQTCIKAMEPIAAFGRRGYSAEAIAAFKEVLRSDRAEESAAAAGALAKIGSAALPTLVDGLADERPGARYACTQAIGSLGTEGKPAAQTLVKLLSDKEQSVRLGALQSLVAVAGDDEELWPTFERFTASKEPEIRYALAVSLSFHPPKGRWWLRPFLRLADDQNNGIRAAVGGMLAKHGPPEESVIDAVERLICDDQQNVSHSTMNAVARQSNPQLLAAVFADGFKSPELWQHFRQHGQLALVIGKFASIPDQAEVAAPLLAKFIETEPHWGQDEMLAAIDGLGSLGPAAKIAFPTLKRLIQSPDLRDNDPIKKHARRSLDKILANDEPAADDN